MANAAEIAAEKKLDREIRNHHQAEKREHHDQPNPRRHRQQPPGEAALGILLGVRRQVREDDHVPLDGEPRRRLLLEHEEGPDGMVAQDEHQQDHEPLQQVAVHLQGGPGFAVTADVLAHRTRSCHCQFPEVLRVR